MSVLGGILNLAGHSVDPAALLKLFHFLKPYGSDGGNICQSGGAGVLYRAFNTTRESRYDRQPLISDLGHVLTWDGRLDNRAELIRLTKDEAKNEPAEITDAWLVSSAYAKWGENFLTHLIGDFAVALWDLKKRTLLLARDPFGVRPLFYHANEHRIIWYSILRELLEVSEARLAVDDDYIAGFLTRYPEPWQTPYKGFHAVRPGSVLAVHDRQFCERTFWRPNPRTEIHYKRDEEYEEHFRQEFREAVRCRLRSDRPVFAELSGGLDSSGIVCMADEILKTESSLAPRLETISYVYDEARSSDERSFIRSVEEKVGRTGHHVKEDDHRFSIVRAAGQFFSAPSYHCYCTDRFNAVRGVMSQSGARVLLSGEGGDQLNITSPEPDTLIADCIATGSFLRLHNTLQQYSTALKKPFLQLIWSGLVLLFPRSLQARCRSIARVPPWLNKDFCRRVNAGDLMLGPKDPYGYRLPSRRDQAEGLLSVIRTVSAISFQEYARVEHTFPYLHRPLVEFLLAVPIEQKVRPGAGRSLVRRSLAALLPEKVLKRKGKKGPTDALCRAIAREWPTLKSLFEDPRVCACGYVDQKQLTTALDQLRHGTQKFTFHLFVTIATEFWLRSLEARRSSANKSIFSAEEEPTHCRLRSLVSGA